MRARVGRWLLGVGLLSGGCTAFGSDPVSTTPPPITPPSDGGTEPSSSGEIGPIDGEVPPPSCPTGAFCDGFERDASDVQGAWTTLTSVAGTDASATLDGLEKRSGASAFHVTFLDDGQKFGPELLLDRDAGAQTHATLSFSFYAQTVDRHVNLAQIDLNGSSTSLIVISLGSGGLFIGRQGDDLGANPYNELTPNGGVPIQPNQWNDVVVDVDFPSQAPTSGVTLNGQQVPYQQDGGTLYQVASPVSITAGCGVNFAEEGGTFDVWFDDVTFITRP